MERIRGRPPLVFLFFPRRTADRPAPLTWCVGLFGFRGFAFCPPSLSVVLGKCDGQIVDGFV